MTAGLDAAVRCTLGRFTLDVALDAAPGATLAVVGPNGAGKTTLLRALAGLRPLDEGRIVLDGSVLDAPAERVWVPPERRSIGMMFQHHLLFPHLRVGANVAFGLRARGASRADANRGARMWLERVGLGDRFDARPDELSGGQAQRAALARALVADPALVLLDEPLSALDAGTRAETRSLLRRHLAAHRGVRLLVTHDPLDAALLGDTVMVVEDGNVVQRGSLADLAARPRTRYVADLVGTNLMACEPLAATSGATTPVLALADGRRFAAVPAGRAGGDGERGADAGGRAPLVAFHPRVVTLHRERPEGSARNAWQLRVREVVVDHLGAAPGARVRLSGALDLTAEVTTAAVADLALAEDREVWASVKASELTVFDR